MSSPRLQQIKSVLATLFLLFVIVGIAVLIWHNADTSFNPNGGSLAVNQNGIVTQDGHKIGDLGVGNEIDIPIVTPTISNVPIALNMTVQFATLGAFTQVTPRVISIEGIDTVSYSWLNSTTLTISSGAYAPDSYTVLRLVAVPGFFHPSLEWEIQNSVHAVSVEWGIYAGLVAVLLSIFAMHRATRRPSWKASGKTNTPPLGLTPIQLAVLHHSTIEPIDFTAFLIDLAVRGYLQIVEQNTDVIFLRTTLREGLTPYESGLLAIIFPNEGEPSRLSLLVQNLNTELFSSVVSQLYVEIYNTFMNRQFFSENPRFAHIRYKTIGILLQLSGLLMLIAVAWLYALYPALLPFGAATYICGWYIYRAARRVSPLTENAHHYILECASFTDYLSAVETIGTEGGQGVLFYSYIPYALTTRVDKQWLNRFANTPWYIPQWFASEVNDTIDPVIFLRQIEHIANTLAQVMVAVKDPNAD